MNPLDFNLADDLLEFDLDHEIPGFDLLPADVSAALSTETVRIRRYPRPTPAMVLYDRAADLAASLPDLQAGESVFALVSGNFIFGDLIEALMVDRNWYAQEILIATLSLSKDNVDSLRNLQDGGYVGRLGLVVSDFWYAHERRPAGWVHYIESTLGLDPGFAFAAAGIHTKVTCIRTGCGRSLVVHGSANLRSSRNVEQFMIDASPALYDFNAAWINRILADFSALNTSRRGEKLWQRIQPEPQKKANLPTGEKAPLPPVNENPNGADDR